MDPFLKKVWAQSTSWTGTYLAMERDGAAVYRQYPGWVGNLDYDQSTGIRSYDFRTRPWYTEVKSEVHTHKTVMGVRESIGKFSVKYTEPYFALDGNGFILSVNAPVGSFRRKFFHAGGGRFLKEEMTQGHVSLIFLRVLVHSYVRLITS